MKKLMTAVMACVFLCLFASCENKNDDVKNDLVESVDYISKENTENEDLELLTKEELIELCDLSEEEYADKDLDEFINYFHFNKENVKKYNIHALLADFKICRNVEYLFDDTAPKRESNFTEDVACIAFRENKNTTVNSVYIDVEEKQKWAYEYKNIFWDLDEFESKPISDEDINDILENFDKLGVFSLKSVTDSYSNITDPMSFSLVIEYKDGTRFKVSRSGRPSKICPKNYHDWRDLLFL